jgi:hypothetical protein
MPGTEMKLHIKKIIMPVIQLRIDWKIKIYIITTVVGAIIGLLILFPLNQVVLFHESTTTLIKRGLYFDL